MASLLIITGPSGSGKTTLIENIVKTLVSKGYKVGVIKHDPHNHFDLDRQEKDTWKYAQAGAEAICLASPRKVAIIKSVAEDQSLKELLDYFTGMDLVLAEGYKYLKTNFPVIEIITQCHKACALNPIALVGADKIETKLPRFNRDDYSGISKFIETILLKNHKEGIK